MPVSRRRLFRDLALTAGSSAAVQGAGPSGGLEELRNVSAAHGANFSDERLRRIKPVLEQRLAQLRALRDLEIDDSVTPHGCL